jgi:hypothetical protein
VAEMNGVKLLVSLQCSVFKDWQNQSGVDSRAKRTSEIIRPSLLFNTSGKCNIERLSELSKIGQ